jgi:phage terminase Nu1 subunit (DNA packaging protein)
MTTGSRSEYAEHIKKSPAYVTKLGHQGRLVEREANGRRVVDFELTDRLIRNTTDMGRARNGTNAKPGSEPSEPLRPIAEAGRVDAIFRQAQAQERAYSAKLAELEYKKAIGELVSAADVQAELSRIFATFREAMQQIPNRLAAVLAAETDQARVHDVLDVEIRNALLHLKERV